jgi:[protein-PII] uridylyltransferase
MTWHNERDRGYTTVKLCTWDRERFFTHITGCLTAAGFNILGAEILTRFDGIILDTFFVTDARTGQLANREERDKFELLVQKILTGAPMDLPALIAKVRPASATYKSLEGERIPTMVELDNATSDTRTIVDLQAEDRVGLLYDVSRGLTELNVNIYLAKILTEKGAAIDTFYIAERNGSKVLDPERQKAIKQRLRQAVQIGP